MVLFTVALDVVFCVCTDLELEFEAVETGKKGVHCIRVRYDSNTVSAKCSLVCTYSSIADTVSLRSCYITSKIYMCE